MESVPFDRVTIARGDVRLSVLTRDGGGRGTVVLLHGLAGSAAELELLAAAIAGEGYRVVVPDQRGHGHSTRRPADLSRAAYVADVVALVDEPAWLVGQSMGAHTAMLAAASRPELCRGLVMIEGGVGGDGDPERIGQWFASWPVPFTDEAAARAFLGDTPIADAWIADLDDLRPRFDADILEAAVRGVTTGARWAEWASITAPTLLILGERSMLGDAEVRRMCTRPGVRHRVVPGAGHDVHLDRPDATRELVVEFVSGG